MTFYRRRSQCGLCPQNGRPRIRAARAVGSKLAIVASMPFSGDEEKGSPLSGPSGRLFNKVLHDLEIARQGLWVTYVAECRPPSDDACCDEATEAIECCSQGFEEEMKAMKASGITTILALGAEAARAIGLEGVVKKIRGSVYVEDGFCKLATYDTMDVMRNGGKRDGDGVSLLAAYMSDVKKAYTISKEGWREQKEDFNLAPTLGDVRSFVADCVRRRALIGVDIETTGLNARRGARPVCIGLATSASKALVVPLLTTAGMSYWRGGEESIVKTLVEELFASCPLVFQNCFFDVPFLHNSGWRLPVESIAHDTLVLHSLISPETEHNLGFITSIFGKTAEWKEDFKNRSVPILAMDQIEMRRYNARDCVVLHQVLPPMLKLLDDYGLTEFYNTETKLLVKPFMEMTESGVGFDAKHMASFKEKMQSLIAESEAELRSTFSLPAALNLDSDDELRYLLFSQRPRKFERLTTTVLEYDVLKTKPLTKKQKEAGLAPTTTTARKQKLFEGVCPDDVPEGERSLPGATLTSRPTLETKKAGTAAFEEIRRLSEVEKRGALYVLKSYGGLRTGEGKLKVSKDGLLSYKIALHNRLSKLDALKGDHTAEADAITEVLLFIEKLTSYGELSKLLTSFTSYGSDPDGRIRPSWLMHGTATGRLSCIAEGSKVLTKRGWIPIEDVRVGDLVWTHMRRWRRVVATLDQGVKEGLRLTTLSGRGIICTSDHRFWTPFGWVEAQEATNVHIEKCPEGQGTHPAGLEGLLGRPLKAIHVAYRGIFGNDRAQRHGDTSRERSKGTHACGEQPSNIKKAAWRKGLELGEEGVIAPELERRMLGQQRAHDVEGGREKAVCSQVGDGKSPRDENPPRRVARTPHRWKWGKQLVGQPRSMYQFRSSKTTQEVEAIAGKSPVGAVRVRDLSVEEDESFTVEGFIVHNCKQPNLAQLPSRGKGAEVREFFVAPPEWKIVDADFENLEVALLGYETRDPIIIDIYESGKNIHDENTRILFGLTPDDELWGEGRKAAKVFQFGGLSYGGGDREIYKKVLMSAPKLPLTFAHFQEAKEAWMAAHPAYVTWKTEITERVLRDRKLYNAFGRMRIFLGHERDIVKEGMNFMIQSAGACVVNRAMVRLYDRFRNADMRTRFIMQVYDEVVLEAPDAEVDIAKAWLQEELTRPFTMHGRTCHVRAEPTHGQTFFEAHH